MKTRFAPSPTGRLHLGHVASALFAAKAGGRERGHDFILRIEDIDHERCKPEYTAGIYEDLAWLGFKWEEPVRVQSQHMDAYKAAIEKLKEMGLLYPCYCTRKEIRKEAEKAGQAPHATDIGFIYPELCKGLSKREQAEREKERAPVWRLDMKKALACVQAPLSWRDKKLGEVPVNAEIFGDVVLARRDIPTCYHISVTVDDALQGVELVTRGEDLVESTHVHRLLQSLLELPAPQYFHHPLLTDAEGNRLAKRDGAIAVKTLRESGEKSEDIRGRLEIAIEKWLS